MSHLTPRQIFDVLTAHDLLREAVVDGTLWTLSPDDLPDVMFDMVTYDSRTSTPTSVLFCKGAFKPEYLAAAVAGPGLGCYVAETEYSSVTTALGFVVTDVRKAMSLLGAAFYGNPQNDLTLVGITGTKGKTTTSYLVHALLAAHTGGKTALMSSEQTILDGKTPFGGSGSSASTTWHAVASRRRVTCGPSSMKLLASMPPKGRGFLRCK